MEDIKGVNVRHILYGILIGAATAAAAAYFQLAALLAPALLAFVFAVWGISGIAGALAAAIALTFALVEPTYAAYLLALYVPASLIIGLVIRNKLAWRSAVCVASLALCVALYLNLCLPSILEGQEPFASVVQQMDEIGAYMTETMSAAGTDADTVSEMRAAIALMEEMMPRFTMYFICAAGMAAALADTLIARLMVKRTKRELRPMTHFALWQLSRQYSHISLAALAGALVALIAGLENSDAVFSAAAAVVLMPLMLTGASSLEFTLRMSKKKSAARRVVFYLLSVLLMPYSFIFLGLMDRITKVRKHYRQRKKDDGDGPDAQQNGAGEDPDAGNEREGQDKPGDK